MNRVLHISANTYPKLNEKEHHTKKIWEELAKGFDEYHIYARSQNNKYSYTIESNIHLHLIPKIHSKSRIFVITSIGLLFIIRRHKITHLTAQSSLLGGVSGVLASKIFKLPILVEIHGEQYFRYLEKNSLISKLVKFSFKNSTKIRSLSESMTKKLSKSGFDENIILIPNRVNLKLFSNVKNSYNIEDEIKLVSVGRFVWEKNYLNLIKTLANTSIKFHLTLIGGGSEKKKYEDFIKKEAVSNNFTIIDWIEQKNMINLINQSDIYIQSSVSEGMPRTILEAMALKLPIISTDVGSIEGILINDYNSILIEPNLNKLENAINKIRNNKEFRFRIANQAHKDVSEKYEWDTVFDKYRNEIKNMKYGS